jgi:hypothetical protein
MTGLLGNRRNGLIVLLVALAFVSLAFVVLASWLGVRPTPSVRNHPFDDYPTLFVEAIACPHRGDVLESGRRSEELARLRADRYAYDPRDGVRAVQRYQEAESCYRAIGKERMVQRVRRAITALVSQVNMDYAAARLNLLNALEQERWSAALSEIRRLLRLTDHIGRHEYVEWLKKIIGTVAAKASTDQ